MGAADTSRAFDPASFRDPSSTVFYAGGDVLRGLDSDAAADWAALEAAPFFGKAVETGRIVRTEAVADAAGLVPEGRDWPVVLRHERVPFVSYPYEWTFSQLQDAALLHLDLLLDALGAGLSMKDGYAYNVQWRGSRPVFIDVPSFQRSSGGPWPGYRQFCQTFLFPLLLQAHKDVSFRPFLRGQVNGIEPRQIRNVMSGRDAFRAGVLRNVLLHSAIENRFAGGARGSRQVGQDLEKAGFTADLTKATATSLRKLVAGLRWTAGDSHWKTYQETNTYTDEDRSAKERFVDAALAGRSPGLVWDLGCNDGTYSRIAARHAETVVAVDGDEATIDALYRALRRDGDTRILPLVMDLTDPSPGIGWRGTERRPFFDRTQPDAVLALALLHHIAITANVPLPAIVDWLHAMGARTVVEFVHTDDPMTKRLLSNKPEGLFPDYRVEVFERLLKERFDVEREERLPSGTRTLYLVTPRG
ncbi:MAG TPA: class I SAM-dependent methyltransferase [Mycobacteriales bacterium]|nr:class I SAM-dependent methyltransferase [Mycobacteriales bacterium]